MKKNEKISSFQDLLSILTIPESKIDRIIDDAALHIAQDETVRDDIRKRIPYRLANDLEFMTAAKNNVLTILAYNIFVASAAPGVTPFRPEPQCMQTEDEDSKVLFRTMVMLDAKALEEFAILYGAGAALYKKRIDSLL